MRGNFVGKKKKKDITLNKIIKISIKFDKYLRN